MKEAQGGAREGCEEGVYKVWEKAAVRTVRPGGVGREGEATTAGPFFVLTGIVGTTLCYNFKLSTTTEQDKLEEH